MLAQRAGCWTRSDTLFWQLVLLLSLAIASVPAAYGVDMTTTFPDEYKRHGCCDGTLGYATSDINHPVVCAEMLCCNKSEIVAVIPVDVALGFLFRCMPRSEVRIGCYEPGITVRSTNMDPDHTPRVCCGDAKFDIVLNQWHAAMVVRCVAR